MSNDPEIDIELSADLLNPGNLFAQTAISCEAFRVLLANDTKHLTFVFNSPQALQTFSERATTLESAVQIQLQSLADTPNQTAVIIRLSQIHNIRIGILASITPETVLTELESNGGIEDYSGCYAPTMSALVKAWRDAFREIIDAHPFEMVTFDMHCQQDIELSEIVRPLQQISTVIYLKRKRYNASHEGEGQKTKLQFRAIGCSARKRIRLQRSLPRDL